MAVPVESAVPVWRGAAETMEGVRVTVQVERLSDSFYAIATIGAPPAGERDGKAARQPLGSVVVGLPTRKDRQCDRDPSCSVLREAHEFSDAADEQAIRLVRRLGTSWYSYYVAYWGVFAE